MKILILGSSGLLGSTITKYFFTKDKYQTFGLVRQSSKVYLFNKKFQKNFFVIEDFLDFERFEKLIKGVKPDLVINCIGITNKLRNKTANLVENYIRVNSLLPHKIYEICSRYDVRFIHLSTDCVFSGNKGFYSENDLPDPKDIYGKSKLLGELNYGDSITIRKSVIGHELITKNGLLEWFLNQEDEVQGYGKAIFSGMTTLELAELIEIYIIPKQKLRGIIHVSGHSISKYELLKLISNIYNKDIEIKLDKSVNINRSLDSSKFNKLTGYKPKSWPVLIKSMYEFNQLDI